VAQAEVASPREARRRPAQPRTPTYRPLLAAREVSAAEQPDAFRVLADVYQAAAALMAQIGETDWSDSARRWLAITDQLLTEIEELNIRERRILPDELRSRLLTAHANIADSGR
jgi:hypothetical protein